MPLGNKEDFISFPLIEYHTHNYVRWNPLLNA